MGVRNYSTVASFYPRKGVIGGAGDEKYQQNCQETPSLALPRASWEFALSGVNEVGPFE